MIPGGKIGSAGVERRRNKDEEDVQTRDTWIRKEKTYGCRGVITTPSIPRCKIIFYSMIVSKNNIKNDLTFWTEGVTWKKRCCLCARSISIATDETRLYTRSFESRVDDPVAAAALSGEECDALAYI